MWKCYIDDSATDDGQLFVAAGAAIARDETWSRVLPRWYAVLAEFGLSYYHAADFNNYRHSKEYSHLTPDEHLACSKKLIACLEDAEMQGFSFAIRSSEFCLALEQCPIPRMKPLDLLLERSICKIQQWGDRQVGSEEVGVAIECGQKIHSELLDMLIAAAGAGGLGRIKHVGFYTKHQCAAFQLADMIAYEGGKACKNMVERPQAGERKSFTAIRTAIPMACYLHTSVDTEMWLRKTREILKDG